MAKRGLGLHCAIRVEQDSLVFTPPNDVNSAAGEVSSITVADRLGVRAAGVLSELIGISHKRMWSLSDGPAKTHLPPDMVCNPQRCGSARKSIPG